MQTSKQTRAATVNHRKTKPSTTLSRKYTRRPSKQSDADVKIKRSPKVQRFCRPEEAMTTTRAKTSAQTGGAMAPAMPHPMQDMANSLMRQRTEAMQQQSASRITAKQLKDQAIQKALASAENVTMEEGKNMTDQVKAKKKAKKLSKQMHFSFGRIMLATACAAAAVFAVVYFVNLNMPDISLRVAAMQTGIEPTYPNYIPRDYSVSGITSEEGKVTMTFTNSAIDSSFTLTEEKSSWDTNALLSNFVKEEYGENYTVIREQGLTIYISGSDAAWVNGGIVYKIDTTSGSLTNKQIRSIAVSL